MKLTHVIGSCKQGPQVLNCTNEEMFVCQKYPDLSNLPCTCESTTSFHKSQINLKIAQVDQPRILPSHHPHSSTNVQCKMPQGY